MQTMDKKTKIYAAAELFVLFDLAVEVAIATFILSIKQHYSCIY
jgi:hypothetical protein